MEWDWMGPGRVETMTFSDSDLDAPTAVGQAPPAGNPATSFSDADLDGAAPAQPNGFVSDVKNDFSNRWNTEGIPALMRSAQGKDSAQETALQLAGNVGAGTVMDVAGQVGKRIPGVSEVGKAVGDIAKGGAQATADATDSTGVGRWIGDALMHGNDVVSDFAANHPGLAADMSGIGNILGAEGVGEIANTTRKGLAAAGENSAKALERPPVTPGLPKDVQDYNAQKLRNSSYVEALNDNADLMKGVPNEDTGKTTGGYGEIYDKAKEISSGVTINAPKVKSNVESLLGDLEDDPAHKTSQGSSQAFRDLKAVADSFDENGDIPLDSVTLLKKRLNDLYDPGMSDTRGKIYSQLNNQINQLIKRAKVENPEWGKIMDSGNDLFLNYKKTFLDDSAANKTWSLDDKKDYERARDSTDPYGAPPLTDTRNKILNMHNISNVADYETMLRKLPPEMHDQFTQDVIAANKVDNPRMANAVRTMYSAARGSPAGVAKNLFRLVTEGGTSDFNSSLAQKYPHVEDAVKYHTDAANDAYQQYMDKLQAAQNPSGPRLALPAPETPMITDSSGATRSMTPQERDAAILARQGANNSGMTMDVRAAQDAKKISDRNARMARAKAFHDQYLGMGSSDLGQEVMRQGNPALQTYPEDVPPFLKGQFARGGVVKKEVNTNPTPGQKMAGNYKKAHVKFHGLDISIENPKGSERRGVGKDGKEWKATMPDHYGYIKRTQGADGDHVDVYLGSDERSNRVYVIDQKDSETGKFDEHKVMLMYPDRDTATRAYREAFSDKKNRIMKVTRMSIAEFKDWLKRGNTKAPTQKTA